MSRAGPRSSPRSFAPAMLLAAATLALPMIDEAHDPRLVEFNAELRRAERGEVGG